MGLKRGDITIMLLGSSQHLKHRQKVKKELDDMKFKEIIIMEEDESLSNLDEKFASIITKQKPNFYFAIFHKNAKSINGIVFEIGWLCGRFGSKNMSINFNYYFRRAMMLKELPHIFEHYSIEQI